MTPMSGPVAGALSEASPVIHPAAADGVFSWLWLVFTLPALGALVILLLGERRSHAWAPVVGTATVGAGFVISLIAFFTLLGRASSDRPIGDHPSPWFNAGASKAEAAVLCDPLSALFLLLITGVGGLIHLYSIGYMAND